MMSTFPPQGGMPGQHPGMPHGQPMPGGVPHPQGMGGPMMHPGVSAPHGQQVSQAPMMGMQPGMGIPGGPNAHAMSHLAPGGGPMMQQPGMGHPGMNPQMMHQNQQQRILWQQRQHQMQRMGLMQQGQPGGINPQQLAAMQASGQFPNLTPHMQQQMQNAQLMHQQQQHQQQQQALQEAHRQQQQQNQLAAQQHAQHMAMQHAQSQGSNQSQPTSQPGPPTQGPMRPASAMAGTTGMEARPSPAPTAGPVVGPQQGPQTTQPSNQPVQQPQTSGPQGPQGQPAPAQAQPNQVQQNPQQPGQAQMQNQMQGRQGSGINPQMAQQAMMQRQQQAAAAAAAAQAQAAQGRSANGRFLLALFNFANKLGEFRMEQQSNDLAYWQAFVQSHFTDSALYRLRLRIQPPEEKTKYFEVRAESLARFFHTQFENTNLNQVQLVLDGSQEKQLSDTQTLVRADRARMLYWFKDGSQVIWNGILSVQYNADKMEQLTFETTDHQTYLPQAKLEELCAQASPNQNRSPKLTKTQQKQKNQQLHPDPLAFDMRRLPKIPVSSWGTTQKLQTYLELNETMMHLQPLIHFSKEHSEMSVPQALGSLVEQYAAHAVNNQQPGVIQGAFPPGGLQAQAGRQNMPMQPGQSPALSAAGLPQVNGASPSPHLSNMAPPMGPSMSQQGSVGGSSNTSPASTNKRRRSTAAGVKGEDGDVGINGSGPGAKMKASPRGGGGANAKRMKGS